MHLTTILLISILQTPGMKVGGLTQLQDTMLLVFTVVITLAVVVQCCILISFAVAGAKARREMIALGKQIHSEMMPLLSDVRSNISETRPKIRQITANATAIAAITRTRATDVTALVSGITQKVQSQATHANQIRTEALRGVDTISLSIRSIIVPAKQLARTVASVKALVGLLRTRVRSNANTAP